MSMTYRQLAEVLAKLTPEQLDSTITVEDSRNDEAYPASFRVCGEEQGLLDIGHPVICF